MSMDRWNPFRDMDSMRQAMDRWMEDRFSFSPFNTQGSAFSVALDVRETGDGYEMEASLPGIKAEDIDINVDRDTVTIRGRSQVTEEQREGKGYLYRERRSGSFYRTIRLPEPVDPDRVEATLDHGVLKVNLPRLAQGTSRKVQVRSGQTGSQNVSSRSGSAGATTGQDSQAGNARMSETGSGYTAAEAGDSQSGLGSNPGGFGSTGSGSSMAGSGGSLSGNAGSTGGTGINPTGNYGGGASGEHDRPQSQG